MSDSNEDRLEELLAAETLGDLSDDERTELNRLTSESPDKGADMRRDLESAASALQRLGATSSDAFPDKLADSIRESGYQAIVRNQVNADPRNPSGDAPNMDPSSSSPQTDSTTQASTPQTNVVQPNPIRRREWFAWAATAASLMLCIGLWAMNRGGEKVTVIASQLHSDLVQLPTVTKIDWANGPVPFDGIVSGDVVWDADRQQGVMRFVGMPMNDPTVEQYQLWIIDPERDDEPIDGGVFDITSSGEVFVAIDAKLNVINPTAFAITIEKPGGVVVSSQERLPLLAAVEQKKS